MQLQLKIQSLDRDMARSREQEADALVTVLRSAVARRGAPPVAIVVRGPQTEIVGLQPVVDEKIPVQNFLAALSQSRVDDGPPPDAVGLMGTFRQQGVGMVQLFLEWPDCAWWHWRALLDAEGDILDDTVTERAAVLGDSLPAQLGRWWSAGRRRGVQMNFHRQDPPAVVVH